MKRKTNSYSCSVPTALAAALLLTLMAAPAEAQGTGTVSGTVTLEDTGDPVHGAVILVVGDGSFALTDEQGMFVVENVSPGDYEVLAQREHLTAGRQTVSVSAGEDATVDFELGLSPVHEEVTVTASVGGAETTFEAFNAVTTIDSFDIIGVAEGSLGDALRHEPGVASRSFGPGSSRPIIRGFDGDRVLILEDGIRTGDLSSQSGDHGVTIDPNTAERIEIVRGPATLLYGSNAVGGLVNVVTPQESYRESRLSGLRAQFNVDGGSANQQVGTNASAQYGQGNVVFWAGGSTRRTDDYQTPLGTVENSATELTNGRAGVGYFGDRFFASGGFSMEDGRYGVPFADEFHGHHDEEHAHEDEHDHEAEDEHDHEAEDDHDHDEEEAHEVSIDLDSRRRVGRFDIGVRNLNNSIIEGARLSLNLIDWQHDELEIEEGMENIGTMFTNRSTLVRAEVDQRQTDRLAGKFGAWAQFRNFNAVGFEALAPETDQTSFAAFAYEEVRVGPVRLQFGVRVERNDYQTSERVGGHDLDHDDEDDHDHEDEDDHDHEDEDDHDHEDEDEDDDHDHDDEDDDHDHDDEDDDHDHDDEDDDHDHDDEDDDHDHDDEDDDHDHDDEDDDHDHDEDDDHDHDDEDDDHDHDEDDDHADEDDHDHDEDDDHADEDDHDHADEDDHDHDHDHEEDLDLVVPDPRNRQFLGASASIGLHADLGADTAFVANLTQSHRAPALEELYNFGPHVGNLAFEVGDPDLNAETTLGLDLSLRHQSDRVRSELNFYTYGINNFIYGERTDALADNLPVLVFRQGDSRFVGFDARGSVRLAENAWVTLGLGYVDARLTATDEALPRIPPLRGTFSLDLPIGGFTLSPQLEFAGAQDRVYRDETATEGYSVVNLRASYVWPRQHTAHILSVTGYNLTNAVYRNHTSFIKDLAPEIGRGVKVGYSVRFF